MSDSWTSAINLLIAAFTLAGLIFAGVKTADILLGRRIENHNQKLQETIDAIRMDSKVSHADMLEVMSKMDRRVERLEDHIPDQNQKISYIQGQSDTMLKLMGLKEQIEKAAKQT